MYDLRVLSVQFNLRARMDNVSRLSCLNLAEKLLLYVDSDYALFWISFNRIVLKQ